MNQLLRALWASLLVALSVMFAAGTASAQTTKLRDELPEHLRDDWDSAGDLFDDANFDAALLEYQKIYKETKNPRVLYNIGVCHKERKYYAQAVSAWEAQLAAKDKLPKAEVERAQSAIETVRQYVTTLEITSNQAGAKLFIKDIEHGLTPVSGPIPIDVGPNRLVLEKEGFARVERTVEITKGTPAKVVLNMIPADKTAPAKIAVTGAEGAVIFIDGTEMGPAPFEGEVPTGRHTFEARKKGFVTARQTSEVVFGQPVRMSLTLTSELNEGKVTIRTGHTDATITIDGQFKGMGTWEGLLPAGGHQLEVKKQGYQTRTQEISLVADQVRVIEISLEADKSTAWIYWTVTGVIVAAGAATAAYFVFRPAEASPVTGTFDPGVVPTIFSF